jgi:hypothetical protein
MRLSFTRTAGCSVPPSFEARTRDSLEAAASVPSLALLDTVRVGAVAGVVLAAADEGLGLGAATVVRERGQPG